MAISTQLQQLLRTLLPDKGFKTAGHHRDAIIAGVEEAKTYTDEKSAEAVKKTGNETIDGIKTFTSASIVPDATLPQHPVTKKQNEELIFSLSNDITGDLIVDEAINATNGYTFASTGSTRTDYIRVDKLSEIYYTGRATGSSGIAFYDETKNYIANGFFDTETVYNKKIEVPESAFWMRASSRESEIVVKINATSNQSISNINERLEDIDESTDNLETNLNSITSLTNNNVSTLKGLNTLYKDGYYSSYNTGAELSETTILGEIPILQNVGDYVEIKFKINKSATVSYKDALNLLLGPTAGDRFGFFSVTEFRIRCKSDSTYSTWTGLTENYREWNILKVEIVAGGWELIVNGISKGVRAKGSNLEITGIAKSLGVAVQMESQKYDIEKITISTQQGVFDYNQLALYAGSSNVIISSISSSSLNPSCFVSYDQTLKKFKIYNKHKYIANKYLMFEVALNSSVGKAEDLIHYCHHYEIFAAKICTYNSSANTMSESYNLLEAGESECVYYYTDTLGTKADHSGGVHGDERIDIDPNSFVKFYIDGQELTSADLVGSFTLIPCNSFKYAQRSSLHDTAVTINNKDTGLAASGAGVLAIDSLTKTFVIDGIDTNIKAYAQNTILTTTAGLTLGISASNTWTISKVIQVIDGNPIVGEHFKETTFNNEGYTTVNTLKFNTDRDLSYWFHGICCLSKNCATKGYNEDFSEYTFIGDNTSNILKSLGNSRFIANNALTKLSAEIDSKVIRSSVLINENCEMYIWDRALDSKYYRSTKYFTPVANEKMVSEMIVKFSVKE